MDRFISNWPRRAKCVGVLLCDGMGKKRGRELRNKGKGCSLREYQWEGGNKGSGDTDMNSDLPCVGSTVLASVISFLLHIVPTPWCMGSPTFMYIRACWEAG